ncbi:MAG: HAD hydrolase-like protein [Candidatus Omnitrophica bacterium]|nr:HAD hydrolase-like protein [Candidatus Omnitrophota bacterium]
MIRILEELFPPALDPQIYARSARGRKLMQDSLAYYAGKSPERLLMVMPMFNEMRRLMPASPQNELGEDALRIKIEELQVIKRVNPDFQWRILAVDDGTPDLASAACVEELWGQIQQEYAGRGEFLEPGQVRIITVTPQEKAELHSKKGLAVLRGLRFAVDEGWAQHIGFFDVDTSISSVLLGNFQRALNEPGVGGAIASRRIKGAEQLDMPWYRNLSSRVFNRCVHMIVPGLRNSKGDRIRDTQRGLKVFTRQALLDILPLARASGMYFDPELLLLLIKRRYKIAEVPIAWFESAEATTVSVLKHGLPMLWGLASVVRKHATAPEHPLGLIFLTAKLVQKFQNKSKYLKYIPIRWAAAIAGALEEPIFGSLIITGGSLLLAYLCKMALWEATIIAYVASMFIFALSHVFGYASWDGPDRIKWDYLPEDHNRSKPIVMRIELIGAISRLGFFLPLIFQHNLYAFMYASGFALLLAMGFHAFANGWLTRWLDWPLAMIPRSGLDIRLAIFDFDDTVSTALSFGMQIEEDMAIEILSGENEPTEAIRQEAHELMIGYLGRPVDQLVLQAIANAQGRGIIVIKDAAAYCVEYRKRRDARLKQEEKFWPQNPPLVKGIIPLLEYFHSRRIPCYVITGGDVAAREYVAEKIGLKKYFKGIYGATGEAGNRQFNKADLIRVIMAREKAEGREVRPGQIAVFGDGQADVQNAKAVGAIAIGLAVDEAREKPLINARADAIVNKDWSDLDGIISFLFGKCSVLAQACGMLWFGLIRMRPAVIKGFFKIIAENYPKQIEWWINALIRAPPYSVCYSIQLIILFLPILCLALICPIAGHPKRTHSALRAQAHIFRLQGKPSENKLFWLKLIVLVLIGTAIVLKLIYLYFPNQSLWESCGLTNSLKGLPDWLVTILCVTNTQTLVSFLIFIPAGEVLGQYLNKKFSGQPYKPLNVVIVIFATLLFYGWFWPLTYILWDGALPRAIIGLADQSTTSPISGVVAFILHRVPEFSREIITSRSIKQTLNNMLPPLRKVIAIIFPTWAFIITVIFLIPCSTDIKSVIVAALQPLTAIFLGCMANKDIRQDERLGLRRWAWVILPCAIFINFGLFVIFGMWLTNIPWLRVTLLLLGVFYYLPALFFGFKKAKQHTTVFRQWLGKVIFGQWLKSPLAKKGFTQVINECFSLQLARAKELIRGPPWLKSFLAPLVAIFLPIASWDHKAQEIIWHIPKDRLSLLVINSLTLHELNHKEHESEWLALSAQAQNFDFSMRLPLARTRAWIEKHQIQLLSLFLPAAMGFSSVIGKIVFHIQYVNPVGYLPVFFTLANICVFVFLGSWRYTPKEETAFDALSDGKKFSVRFSPVISQCIFTIFFAYALKSALAPQIYSTSFVTGLLLSFILGVWIFGRIMGQKDEKYKPKYLISLACVLLSAVFILVDGHLGLLFGGQESFFAVLKGNIFQKGLGFGMVIALLTTVQR